MAAFAATCHPPNQADNTEQRQHATEKKMDAAIAGRDPKAFPPPMKLCAPMVEAMGGSDSPYYRHFRTYCCEAYNILRKSAGLILSLFHLMAGAAIPDVRQDPEKAMLKLQVSMASQHRPNKGSTNRSFWVLDTFCGASEVSQQ